MGHRCRIAESPRTTVLAPTGAKGAILTSEGDSQNPRRAMIQLRVD